MRSIWPAGSRCCTARWPEGTVHPTPRSGRRQRRSARIGDVGERQRVSSGSPFEPTIGFSRAVRVGDRVWVSGTGPVWADGSCPDDARVQARRCFDIITAALADAGATLPDVVRTRMYLISADDADAVSGVHGELFSQILPAATMVVVTGLVDPRWKVEIEVDAVLPQQP
jgi:enamine deaminase RidA (YjgF/YER057c/UK114 family)